MYNKLKDKPGDLEGINNLMWASITAYVVPFYSYSDDVSVDILSRAIVGVLTVLGNKLKVSYFLPGLSLYKRNMLRR